MRLNSGGTDFDNVNFNSAKGSYTFIHSNLNNGLAWSTVSEAGSNIYTKLDLRKADLNYKIYLSMDKLNCAKKSYY